jgi:uncharacterized protein (DUF1697 family)
MPRYAAFLRGVSPMNAKMPELKRAFEKAGFDEVRTVLGSGNVVFSARAASDAALQRRAEAAMKDHLGRAFVTIIRSVQELQALLAKDPFARYRLPAGSKRIVTFLREAPARTLPDLPDQDGARILQVTGREVFTTYVPTPKGPVFMTLIEKTFGTDVTTRTWDTVKKVAR